MSPFTSTFVLRDEYLWVPRPAEADDSLGAQMLRTFQPFKGETWLLLVSLPLALGLVKVVSLRVRCPRHLPRRAH